jgi:hypothetical protein
MTTDRARTILEDLERKLLGFMRKHKITHDEYRCATDVLVATVKAGEETLLYDVFFEAQATDIDNIRRQGSIEAIEGPFYLPNAPRLEAPYALPQRSAERGDVLFFCGRVTSSDGTPLAGAELDNGKQTPMAFTRTSTPTSQNGTCVVASILVPMARSRSGRLFRHLTRFPSMARPELCSTPLAGIFFARLICT